MDATGSEPTRLTPATLDFFQETPEWSPDGQRLLFIVRDRGEGGTLYVINADRSGLHSIPSRPVVSASWAPDGGRIAAVVVVTLPGCCTTTNRLFLLDPDGANPRDISPEDTFYETVEWSPDGERLAIVSFGGVLFIADTLGSPLVRVGPAGGILTHVSWSPDGQRITFALSEDSGPSRIFTMNRDGSGLLRQTEALPMFEGDPPINDFDPAWGP
jgi:Tol biopolymer transport system component